MTWFEGFDIFVFSFIIKETRLKQWGARKKNQ